MFKRKGKLRDGKSNELLALLQKANDQWLQQKRIIEASIEPSDEVLYRLKLAQTKYLFLLKEAKYRQVNFNQKVKL